MGHRPLDPVAQLEAEHVTALHPSTFEYLKPTEVQVAKMGVLRKATAAYARVIEASLPDGPDKTFVLRELRGLSMWINVSVTRQPDGSPRE